MLLVCLLAGCSAPHPTGAPPPTAGDPTPPAPVPEALAPGDVRLAVGDSWAYAIVDANGTDQGTQQTAVVELTGTTAILSTRTDGGSRSSTSRLEARQGDLAIVSLQSDLGFTIVYDPPLPLVLPASDHAQQGHATLKGPTGNLAADVNLTVKFLGPDRVAVPAGNFEALRYHIVVSTGGAASTRQESDVWFAAAVKAPVKTVEANGRTEALTGYHVG